MDANTAVLRVRDLHTWFPAAGGRLEVLRGVDLDVFPGEVVGLLGESGSGKSMTALSLLHLLPDGAHMRAGELLFKGRDLQALDDRAFQALRGLELAMVFQNPPGAFNPVRKIGWHMQRVLRRRAAAAGSRDTDVLKLLGDVGIADPARVLNLYPHQLSGGMLQRVLIAMVVSLRPALIVADEPTASLDNIVERQILALFQRLKRQMDAAMIFITHDIAAAATLCDRIAIMYAGQIVEVGMTATVLDRPAHPYTAGLLAAATALDRRLDRLTEIPGQPPRVWDLPPGCAFEPRCTIAIDGCWIERPPVHELPNGHAVRCTQCH